MVFCFDKDFTELRKTAKCLDKDNEIDDFSAEDLKNSTGFFNRLTKDVMINLNSQLIEDIIDCGKTSSLDEITEDVLIDLIIKTLNHETLHKALDGYYDENSTELTEHNCIISEESLVDKISRTGEHYKLERVSK